MKALLMIAALTASSALTSATAFAGPNMTSAKGNAHSLSGITRSKGCTPEGDYIQWQCGGRPSGAGWVKVSPTCWHRSIGHC